MACGVPTISTRTSSLSENLEGAAELVPVDDVDALTEAMSRLLKDETYRERCRKSGLELAKQYRWERTARETLAGYRAAVESFRHGRA
jgi:alpha-1,3-rhamnosyl/mannosyltransferase